MARIHDLTAEEIAKHLDPLMEQLECDALLMVALNDDGTPRLQVLGRAGSRGAAWQQLNAHADFLCRGNTSAPEQKRFMTRGGKPDA